MNIITLDIETVPSSLDWVKQEIRDNIKAPANYKKPDTITKWHEEHAESTYEDKWKLTALDTSLAEIVCIGVKLDDTDVATFHRPLQGSEAEIINDFWNYIVNNTPPMETVWVTFNGNSYDIPLLWHRSKILGVHMPRRLNPFPRNDSFKGPTNYYDVMEAWCGKYTKSRISLDRLARLFGLEGKQGMTGADVYPAMLAGDFDKVAEYCAADVLLTYNLYNKLNHNRR